MGARADRPPVDNSCPRSTRPAPALHAPRTLPAPCTLPARSLRARSLNPSPTPKPRCGWFAERISQWPKWDPTATAMGEDDPLQARSEYVGIVRGLYVVCEFVIPKLCTLLSTHLPL